MAAVKIIAGGGSITIDEGVVEYDTFGATITELYGERKTMFFPYAAFSAIYTWETEVEEQNRLLAENRPPKQTRIQEPF